MGKVLKALYRASEGGSKPNEGVSKPNGKNYSATAEGTGAGRAMEREVRGHDRKIPVQSKPTAQNKRPRIQSDASPDLRRWNERLRATTALGGPVAESFKTLRTRILHPFMGETPRSILITSAGPSEGKSFACANLGVSLAQGVGQYCLMVDCDLRRPSLNRLFGLSNDYGLVDHLMNQVSLDQLILKTGASALSILPSGPPPKNPAELLDSSQMVSFIQEVVWKYNDRIVIFDSPPVTAAAETAILAKHVDAVVLVVRWGKSRREHVKELVELVGREKIIGVVFNAYKTNILEEKILGYYEYQQNYYYKQE